MQEMESVRQECRKLRREVDDKIYAVAKKILRQPYELNKEIRERENTDMMIDKFIKG